jgi:hypothetical protein
VIDCTGRLGGIFEATDPSKTLQTGQPLAACGLGALPDGSSMAAGHINDRNGRSGAYQQDEADPTQTMRRPT